jgi:hypothetical protein
LGINNSLLATKTTLWFITTRFGDYLCNRPIAGGTFATEVYDVILNPLAPGVAIGTGATSNEEEPPRVRGNRSHLSSRYEKSHQRRNLLFFTGLRFVPF